MILIIKKMLEPQYKPVWTQTKKELFSFIIFPNFYFYFGDLNQFQKRPKKSRVLPYFTDHHAHRITRRTQVSGYRITLIKQNIRYFIGNKA